jgi:Family of unknown function (DUF6011)
MYLCYRLIMITTEATETETTEAKLQSPLSFILAGNAYFTIRSVKTGARYTYRVSKAEDGTTKYFVSFLVGPDNYSNYKYLGMIENNTFRLTKASLNAGFNRETKPVVAFSWTFEKLKANVEPPNTEIWHAGRCGRCGRKLTVPESIELGLGPECASKGMGA